MRLAQSCWEVAGKRTWQVLLRVSYKGIVIITLQFSYGCDGDLKNGWSVFLFH